jgi:hypothetical protein
MIGLNLVDGRVDSNDMLDSDSDDSEYLSADAVDNPVTIIMKRIFSYIQLLYDFGLLLHRISDPSPYHQSYLKSGASEAEDSLLSKDRFHIRETIRKWRNLQYLNIKPYEEKKVTPDDIQRRADKTEVGLEDLSNIIVDRLAKANVKRREQFSYWVKYPDKPPVTVESERVQSFQHIQESPALSIQRQGTIGGAESVTSARTKLLPVEAVGMLEVPGSHQLESTKMRIGENWKYDIHLPSYEYNEIDAD